MIYLYECPEHDQIEVIKPASLIDVEEPCDVCAKPMRRVFNFKGQMMAPGGYKENFHPAFGKVISTKIQLKNELKRIKGETGKELIEVGNESMEKIKPIRKKIDKGDVVRELRQRIRNG